MDSTYPMRTVAKKTGLSPHVIRIWERRYGAVIPSRTATNRRVYSEQDLEKLDLLKKLTQVGYLIGDIARYSSQELQMLWKGSERVDGKKTTDEQNFTQKCLEKISNLDEQGFLQTLNEAILQLSQRQFLESFISPLIDEVGRLWENGTLRIAHEHFTTHLLRTYLSELRSVFSENSSSPRIVVGTPAGQVHEIGALLVAKTAQSEGWQVIYLGPNLPAEELAASVIKSDAKVLALSVVYPPDDPVLNEEIKKIAQLLPSHVQVIYGGRSASAYREVIQAQKGKLVGGLGEFRQWLQELRGRVLGKVES